MNDYVNPVKSKELKRIRLSRGRLVVVYETIGSLESW